MENPCKTLCVPVCFQPGLFHEEYSAARAFSGAKGAGKGSPDTFFWYIKHGIIPASRKKTAKMYNNLFLLEKIPGFSLILPEAIRRIIVLVSEKRHPEARQIHFFIKRRGLFLVSISELSIKFAGK
jgi:hypothetical protein